MEVFIVIPAFNEEKTIGEVVKKAKKYGRVVVVDDGSTDATAEEARKAGADFVLRNRVNMGKGFALKKAFEFLKPKLNPEDVVITMDADLQHDPALIPEFVKAVRNGAEMVIGNRTFGRMPFHRKLANLAISVVIALLFKVPFGDTQSGFRAYSGRLLKDIEFEAKDYFVDTELYIKACRAAKKVSFVNIPAKYFDEWKGTSLFDGIKIGFKTLAMLIFG